MEAIGTIVDRLIVKARIDLARLSEDGDQDQREEACGKARPCADGVGAGHASNSNKLPASPVVSDAGSLAGGGE